MIDAEHPTQRWASRKEATAYARVGATPMNHLMREGRIHAKKLDSKRVLADLNSIDALFDALPRVGAVR
jgi:predicted transcriptional regulator